MKVRSYRYGVTSLFFYFALFTLICEAKKQDFEDKSKLTFGPYPVRIYDSGSENYTVQVVYPKNQDVTNLLRNEYENGANILDPFKSFASLKDFYSLNRNLRSIDSVENKTAGDDFVIKSGNESETKISSSERNGNGSELEFSRNMSNAVKEQTIARSTTIDGLYTTSSEPKEEPKTVISDSTTQYRSTSEPFTSPEPTPISTSTSKYISEPISSSTIQLNDDSKTTFWPIVVEPTPEYRSSEKPNKEQKTTAEPKTTVEPHLNHKSTSAASLATAEPTPEPTLTSSARSISTPEPRLKTEPTSEPKSTTEPEPTPETKSTAEPTPELKSTPESTPEPKSTTKPTSEPKSTAEPTPAPKSTPEPTSASKSNVEPTSEPKSTSEPTSVSKLAAGPSSEPKSTAEPTSEPKSTPEPTPEPKSSAEPSPETKSTSEPTPEPRSTAEPIPEPKSTAEPTSEPKSTSEPTSEPKSTAEPTPEPKSSAEPSPETKSTSEPTPEPRSTAEPIPEPKSTAEPTSEPKSTSEPTPEPKSTAEPTPEPKSSVEPSPESKSTAEPKSTSEPTPEPKSTAEPTPEPKSSVEPSPEPKSTAEPKSTSEPTPEPKSTAEPTPEPKSSAEPSPETKSTSEPTPEAKSSAEPTPEPKSTAEPTSEPKSSSEPIPEPKSTAEPKPEPKSSSEPTAEPKSTAEPGATPEPGRSTRPGLSPGVPTNEPEPEPSPGTSEPGAEPETEPESEFSAFSEPQPEWDVAMAEWKWGWYILVYVFGALFIILALFSLLSVVRLWKKKHLLSKNYFMVLNLLIIFKCVLRAIYLLVDPFNINNTFHAVISYFLYSTAFPCITAAFSILFYALLLATKMKVLSAKIQKISVLITIIAFHFVLSLATDIVVGISSDAKIMLLVCQFFYILWGIILFSGYFYIYRRLHESALMRQRTLTKYTSVPSMSNKNGTLTKNSHPTRKRSKYMLTSAIKVTLVAAAVGLLCVAVELYGIFDVYKVYLVDHTPQPWPWYIYQFLLRVTELLMCSLMVYVASQPIKYRQRKSQGVCYTCCLPFRRVLMCQKDDAVDMDMTSYASNNHDNFVSSNTSDSETKKRKLSKIVRLNCEENGNGPQHCRQTHIVIEDGIVRFKITDDTENVMADKANSLPDLLHESVAKETEKWSDGGSSGVLNEGYTNTLKDDIKIGSNAANLQKSYISLGTIGTIDYQAPSIHLADSLEWEYEQAYDRSFQKGDEISVKSLPVCNSKTHLTDQTKENDDV
ncbi:hypothetical protein FSP39_005586 [Pinctada imbricata]|uniref:Proline-rich transmembrane protein 3/4 domain-containing protein n=1 Tax=Pinctada imbricata TaxID=66713 RepID=A0AA88YHT9_PINIB|nr:hypothetical protein FSP39_005586 [Pinctada imbricata]